MSGKVIKRFPENSTYIDTYAFILMKLHKFNAAYKWMKKAVILNKGGDPEIYEHMGDILFLKGNKQEAIIFWKKAKENGRSDINIDEKPKLLIK
jgi:predicted negative regulator of RcsB-dependent stress response